MKRTRIYITGLLAVTLLFSSCLKDKIGEDWTSSLKGKMYAYVVDFGFKVKTLQAIPDAQTFTFKVSIGTDALPTKDITVKLGMNQASMTAYNTLNKTNYKLYPNVSFSPSTVVIKAGTRYSGTITAVVTGADKVNACDSYMAPVGITSVDNGVIIATNGTLLMSLPIGSAYSGDYLVTGYRIRPGNATEPIVNWLETFDPVGCAGNVVIKHYFGNYGYDVKITVTTTPIVVGGTTCYVCTCDVLDPVSGASVGTTWPVWTGDINTPPFPVDQTINNNYWNPVTKTFVLNCKYYSSAGDRIMYEWCVKQ